jgi:hypothetical protein
MIGGIVIARKTPPQSQPFTTKGDLSGEATVNLPQNQRKKLTVTKERL